MVRGIQFCEADATNRLQSANFDLVDVEPPRTFFSYSISCNVNALLGFMSGNAILNSDWNNNDNGYLDSVDR